LPEPDVPTTAKRWSNAATGSTPAIRAPPGFSATDTSSVARAPARMQLTVGLLTL